MIRSIRAIVRQQQHHLPQPSTRSGGGVHSRTSDVATTTTASSIRWRVQHQQQHRSLTVASSGHRKLQLPTLTACHSTCATTGSILTTATTTTVASQRRSFASNPKQQQNHKPSEAGRIVLHQNNIKKLKPGQVKLCHGCGTEVRRASFRNDNQISAHQIIAGVDANKDMELSKKQAKKARFADAMAVDKGAFLCDRCKALQSENIYRAYDALADVSPEVFSSQLQHIVGRRQYGLCIVVVDATDPEHSAVKNIRRSIGQKTPVWLVINKIDLVPKMDHRTSRVLSHRIASIMGLPNFHNYFAVSSISGKGIYELAERLLVTLGGKDVFIVGCANVGKSTLVHQLSGTIAMAVYLKGKRGQTRREMCNNLPVTGSHLPGTTLQAVRIPCFTSDRHALWDTPGIINRKAIQYALFPVHIMEPMARPEIIPLPSKEAGTQGHWETGYTVLIEAAWMDSEDDEIDDTEDKNDAAVADTRSVGQKIIDAQPYEDALSDDEEDGNDDDEEEIEDSHERELRLKDEAAMRRRDEDDAKFIQQHKEDEKGYKHDDKERERDDQDRDEIDDNNPIDDDDIDTPAKETDKRQAAYEKKMAIVAAAKERRRLKDEGFESNYGGSEKRDKPKKPKPKTKEIKADPNKVYRGPCVLGRIDLINVENGQSVYAQAYVHPALRVRIVPTSEAPNHASVPTSYLKTILKKMEDAAGRNGAVATKLKPSYSLPLKPFSQNQTNGEVIPGDKEYNASFDSYYMDVVFASLGWIAISHRGKFTIVPHCVEGSVFSKRPSLYPTNIATRLVSNPDYEEDSTFSNLSDEEALDRLRAAAKQGRHAGGGGSGDGQYHHHGSSGTYNNSSSRQQQQYGGMMNDGDLFNYSDAPDDSEWY